MPCRSWPSFLQAAVRFAFRVKRDATMKQRFSVAVLCSADLWQPIYS